MFNRIAKFKYLLKLIIFIPLIFSFGKRSYIAFDEGFYALQARWILEKGNWTIPLWWDEYVLDRTCLLYTSPSPRDQEASRMPSSA